MIVWIFVFFIFIKESHATKYREYKKTNGFDQRPFVPESTLLRHYLIPKFFEKKRLLDVLQNPRVPLHTKIRALPNPSVEPPNIKAGGLLKDWSFDMEESRP
jgi:hypothetical protein